MPACMPLKRGFACARFVYTSLPTTSDAGLSPYFTRYASRMKGLRRCALHSSTNSFTSRCVTAGLSQNTLTTSTSVIVISCPDASLYLASSFAISHAS